MSKFFRRILLGLIASVGLFIIIIVVLEALGIDTGLSDICNCNCRCSSPKEKSATKIRRNYTEITLPQE